mgnify:CR=1 FL=1
MARAGAGAVHVRGLREFQAGLRSADPKLARTMRVANKEIASKVASRAQSRARSGTPVQAKASAAIVGAAEQRAAKIAVNKGTRFKFADGAFYGAKAYQQFDPWVGNTWEPGGAGGPAAINPAIADSIPEIEEFYLDAFEDAVAGAFPDDLASLGRTVIGR